MPSWLLDFSFMFVARAAVPDKALEASSASEQHISRFQTTLAPVNVLSRTHPSLTQWLTQHTIQTLTPTSPSSLPPPPPPTYLSSSAMPRRPAITTSCTKDLLKLKVFGSTNGRTADTSQIQKKQRTGIRRHLPVVASAIGYDTVSNGSREQTHESYASTGNTAFTSEQVPAPTPTTAYPIGAVHIILVTVNRVEFHLPLSIVSETAKS
ncbi:uncharacterized protein EDB91DRAFT_1243435 [Suillus paluster]|uniref:uncharacterized protein n=1 Tax=Suillus paluster TaxID=48578 RepID=UPI001B880565|nr:uncharacterized protein EDB91DRAFT_1243435 [Suillus paluster]KAG1752669.1 hypothetical protein EDB91DRAFT_1243435 [Suillus paluster]